MTDVLAVVQARMGSSRQPGKVLRPLGPTPRPVLSWIARALAASRLIDDIVIATTELPEDDAIVRWAIENHVAVSRGSTDDVLDRFVSAIAHHRADLVVRVTADCPFIDPSLVDLALRAAMDDPTLEYVTTVGDRSFPRGLDVEVVRRSTLHRLHATATGVHRTHVTSALYADGFVVPSLVLTAKPSNADLRVTLDTVEDAALLHAIALRLGDRVLHWREIVELLRSDPELTTINAHVRQKALVEG